jgi:Cu-processing system permease protein
MRRALTATLTVAHLTWIEARRRRIVLAAVLGGLLFLLVFAAAVFVINRSVTEAGVINIVQRRAQLQFLMLAGLYVVNFLTIAVAILLPVDTLSGEISSGIMQTLVSKPIRRAEILLGKWLTYWLMTACYLLLLAGGVVIVMRVLTGFPLPSIVVALPLMLLGATVLLSVSLAGGVRLTTITNGMVAFAFYGIAFVGGWIEQIGAFTRNDAARHIGTAISLISPPDAMWRRAAYELQPPVVRDLQLVAHFAPMSVPSAAMIVWTIGFVLVVLMLALHQFRRRAL